MFMPGIPQVWYLDIFAGENNYEAADNGGSAGHKEINRTTLSMEDVTQGLKTAIVKKQLEIIRLRNTTKAFLGKVEINADLEDKIDIKWINDKSAIHLKANLAAYNFTIEHTEQGITTIYNY
jgi:sucrose phosphorylase